jgi:hypothetical protein
MVKKDDSMNQSTQGPPVVIRMNPFIPQGLVIQNQAPTGCQKEISAITQMPILFK